MTGNTSPTHFENIKWKPTVELIHILCYCQKENPQTPPLFRLHFKVGSGDAGSCSDWIELMFDVATFSHCSLKTKISDFFNNCCCTGKPCWVFIVLQHSTLNVRLFKIVPQSKKIRLKTFTLQHGFTWWQQPTVAFLFLKLCFNNFPPTLIYIFF